MNESFAFEKINPDRIRSNGQKNLKLQWYRKQINIFYPESEVACKNPIPLFETQYLKIIVEYEKVFDMKAGKVIIEPAQPYQNRKDEKSYILVKFHKSTGSKDDTELQQLSLMNNTNFCALNCDKHLDIRLYNK